MNYVLSLIPLMLMLTLPPQQTVDAARAEQAYRNNCMICHGQGLEGGFGPALLHVGSRKTKEQIAQQIRYGGAIMPAFGSQLDTRTIDALAEWLSLKK
ncbi:c-type cytochrome [Brevibacillus sp. NRS-1366]|uniref:c-type cytochrome n=1 Tax=Brevibacillus sp. NRS-1366 TaxID=3233899 RepID=UPI003D21197D